MKQTLYILFILISTIVLSGCSAIIMGIEYTISDKKKNKDEEISNNKGWLEISNKIDSTTLTKYLIKKKKFIFDSTKTLNCQTTDSTQIVKFYFKNKILCCQITQDSILLITNIYINEKYYKGDTINRKYSKIEFDNSIYYNNSIYNWSCVSKNSIGYFNGIKTNSAFRLKKMIYRKINKLTKKAIKRG